LRSTPGTSGRGRQLGDELLDLPLGPVDGAREEEVSVLRCEVRGDLGDAGEMEPTVREHLQEHGVLTSRPGCGDAEVGLGLGEVKDVHAIDEHRGGGLAGIETSSLDLGDMGDEVGLGAAGLAQKVGESAEELVVGEGFERPFE
jgi:hypothetical protein